MAKVVEYKIITDTLPKGGDIKTFETKTRQAGITMIIKLANSGLFDPALKSKPTKIIVKKEISKKSRT